MARAVGTAGRVLIGTGVVILLFAAYQLWGTGLQHSRAQDRLGDEFAAQLEGIAAGEAPGATSTMPPSTTATTVATEPVTTATTAGLDADLVEALNPDQGEPVAQLRIPAIGVEEIVVHGVDVADLRHGPGRFPESPLPGQPGNAAIAGHRTTYGQPFHDLDEVRPGDEITVRTLQGEFTYEVMAHPAGDGGSRGYFIVPETGVEVLDDMGDDRLTLIACHPKFSSRERIIVTARLVEEPAPAAPAPAHDPEDPAEPGGAEDPAEAPEPDRAAAGDFGEGLDGDTDALGPTALWGTGFLVALAAIVAGARRWRRWPAYVLGSPVLAVFLFFTFVHLDQYLPAY